MHGLAINSREFMEARVDAEKQVNLALTEIQAGASEARVELEKTSQLLAADIAAQVLGRPVAEG